jgi:hypothetical protein
MDCNWDGYSQLPINNMLKGLEVEVVVDAEDNSFLPVIHFTVGVRLGQRW